jgi:MFS family permease
MMAATLGVTTMVSYGTTQYLFGVLVVPITRELGWDRATISGAYSLGLIISGLLGVPVGRLVDRGGARTLMTVGSFVGGVSLIFISTIQQPWQLYALWSGGLGLAMALTFYPVTFTVVTQWFKRRRGSAMALLTTLGGLASPVFYPLAGWLVPQVSWRGTVIALGASQLVICVPLHALLVRSRPEESGLLPDGDVSPHLPSDFQTPLQGHTLFMALRRPAFWTLTLSSSLLMMSSTVLFAHQVAYLIGRGYEAVLAATLAGAVGIASLPGRFVLNVLSERVG